MIDSHIPQPTQDAPNAPERAMTPHDHRDNDPLWRLRHALAGVALALLASVLIAALVGRLLGDLITDSYSLRAGIYAGLLLYVVVGAVLLFTRVAQHETRPLRAGRVLLWLASLWLWPALLLSKKKKISSTV